MGQLNIRIGNSFADVWLDGKMVLKNSYGDVLRLPPGKHTILVRKPGEGSFKERVVAVEGDGSVTEAGRPVIEIGFPVPKPGSQEPQDWVKE
jgi:hypothetical protein